MEVTITIDDAAVRAMLRRAPDRINWAMRAAMNDATTLLLTDMRAYPTQRAGSKYVRRNEEGLKGSWSRTITGQGLGVVGRVGSNPNKAPYNRRVQDATMQARVHQGRWQTVQSVTRQRDATIRGFFETRLREGIG